LEEPIMWTTTHGKQLGSDQLPTTTPANKELRCNNSRMWRDRDIRLVCCQKIGQAPTHRRMIATRPHRHQTRSTRPLLLRWSRRVRRPQELVNFQQAGSKGIHLKEGRTLSTTTLAQPRGWTREGSSTSGCTVDRTLAETTPPSNNSPSRSLVLFPVDGRCVSPTLPECTLSTTTQRQPPGTILAYHHPWTRTCHSTSVTSGES
jgi:hypothetical protein